MTGSADAAATIRRLLEEVDAGRLDAPGRAGARLRHRLEGAAAALEAADHAKRLGPRRTGPTHT